MGENKIVLGRAISGMSRIALWLNVRNCIMAFVLLHSLYASQLEAKQVHQTDRPQTVQSVSLEVAVDPGVNERGFPCNQKIMQNAVALFPRFLCSLYSNLW